MLGEGLGKKEAYTYHRHEAQLAYFLRRAVPPPSGLGAPSAGRTGAGMRGGGIQVEGVPGLRMTKVAGAPPAHPALNPLGLLICVLLFLDQPKIE